MQIRFMPAGGAYEQQWCSVFWVSALNKAELRLWTQIQFASFRGKINAI